MTQLAPNAEAPASIEPISGTEFWARVQHAEGTIRVALVGNGDVRAQNLLETFLSSLHAEATRRTVTSVEIDCRELVFMNSSCLKAIVSWIALVQEAEPTHQYRICFLSNPRLHWQKRSMRAISCFAAELVTIQE